VTGECAARAGQPCPRQLPGQPFRRSALYVLIAT